MDPPTHGLLGAVIGQAFFARRLGRRALPWGAVLNMLPDVDVVVVPLLGGLAEWRYHRAATHSLLVLPLVGLALGWLFGRADARGGEAGTRRAWTLLAILSLAAHPLADAFTSYGTVLFWPWPRRFAWDAVAIVDFIFTGVLLLALLIGWIGRARPRLVRLSAVAALAFLAAYEVYGLRQNARAEAEARRQAEILKAERFSVHAYPVLALPWLRRVVVRQGDGVAVGWISTWKPGLILFHRLTTAVGSSVDAAHTLEPVRMFEWFAMGQTAASYDPKLRRLEIDDLRYGFPSDAQHGIWGVRVMLDERNAPVGAVERVRRPRPPTGPMLGWLWRATFRGEIE
jgi:inner membrane protein